MLRPLLLLTTLGLFAADVAYYGRCTNRWQTSRELEQAVTRLREAPPLLEGWTEERLELTDRVIERAEIAGYLYRRFEDPVTHEAFTVLVLAGRPGPLAVHTPDVCYQAAGFKQTAPEEPVDLTVGEAADPARLWSARFTKEQALVPSRLQVFWGWNATGTWQASDRPRTAYAGHAALYKLYVMRETTSTDDRREEGLCRDFLERLLPRLDRVLFSPR